MLERIKKDLLAAINAASKRDLKILRHNFDTLSEEQINSSKERLSVKGENDLEKELILFYLKGKPTLKIDVSFETFEKYQLFLTGLEQ